MPSHVELSIMKGLGPVPGDTNSAEQPVEVLNLLDAHGFSVTENGWVPKLAQIKSSAIYADSPLTDGRTPVSITHGNVIETITLTAVAASWDARYWLESRLVKMACAAKEFWAGIQIEPVYLKWWSQGAPGPQYALICLVDIAQNVKAFLPVNANELTITVEREPYWRSIPPGANPKQYTYEYNGDAADFDLTTASLVTGSDHHVYQVIQNKLEWNAAVAGAQSDLLSQNYVDIPAEKVPGDAPALVCVSVRNANNEAMERLLIAATPHKSEAPSHDGNVKRNAYILAGGDGYVRTGTKTTGTATTGVRSNGSAATYYRVTQAIANTTYTDVVIWGSEGVGGGGPNYLHLNRNLLRGRFLVYCRNIGASNIALRLTIRNSTPGYVARYSTDEVPSNTAAAYRLSYMGILSFPETDYLNMSLVGYGTQIHETTSELTISLDARNTTGSGTPTLNVIDLILVPIHAGTLILKTEIDGGGGVASSTLVADNTGYLSRGADDAASGYQSDTVHERIPIEMQGSMITLIPQVDNRVHFLVSTFTAPGVTKVDMSEELTVRLNIVPRWIGARSS